MVRLQVDKLNKIYLHKLKSNIAACKFWGYYRSTKHQHFQLPVFWNNSDGAFSKADCSKPKYQIKFYLKAEFAVNGEHSWLFQNPGS